MALPRYDKTKRRQTFEQLPKGAYVVKIIGAKEDTWPDGSKVVKIAFDIAEGPYKGYYNNIFEQRKKDNENALWPFDGVFNLNVPDDSSDEKTWRNYNTFFADLEDSNNGFVFSGDLKTLKRKLIGGKFRIKQTQAKKPNKDGAFPIYNNTEMLYTCVAEDVRQGKAGKLPNDKLLAGGVASGSGNTELDGFVNLPAGGDEDLPF